MLEKDPYKAEADRRVKNMLKQLELDLCGCYLDYRIYRAKDLENCS